MNDDGYTLVEVLVALMIIGLVMGSMTAAVAAIGRLQRSGANAATTVERARSLSNGLDDLLVGQGPFTSAGGLLFRGDGHAFGFSCGQGQRCEARIEATAAGEALVLRSATGTRRLASGKGANLAFRYIGAKSTGDHWPPDNPTDWQPLRLIVLGDSTTGFRPIATSRLWIEGERGPAIQAPGAAP